MERCDGEVLATNWSTSVAYCCKCWVLLQMLCVVCYKCCVLFVVNVEKLDEFYVAMPSLSKVDR